MTAATPPNPPAPEDPSVPGPADAGDAVERKVRDRIEHLFRHTLRARQVNPLLHMAIRHRLESIE